MPKRTSKIFFPGHRRKLELVDWRPLRDGDGHKEIRLDLLMPISGQSLRNMPDWIAPGYEKMDVENSAIDVVNLGTELKAITLELYAKETSQPIEVTWGVGLDEAEAQEELPTVDCRLSTAGGGA